MPVRPVAFDRCVALMTAIADGYDPAMLLAIDHGHAIAFDRHGREVAPPVVLLHGLSSSRETYRPVVEHLLAGPVDRGDVQLVNVDLRGHGQSSHADLERYDAASYAADVVAMIEHTDAGSALLVGHSLGGVVAVAVGARSARSRRAAAAGGSSALRG